MLYHELLIRLDPAPGGGFLARLMGPGVGQAFGALNPRLDERTLDGLADRFELGAQAGGSELPPEEALLGIGRELRDALFSAPIRDAFFALWGRIGSQGLRIRLQAAPEAARLLALPWEALLWPNRDDSFLSLDRRLALVRSIDLPVPCPPLPLGGPLRILVVASAPRETARLDLEAEIRQLEEVFSRRQARVKVLPRADLGKLRSELVSGSFHVLHFLGHGGVDPVSGKGQLLFEREDGSSVAVSGEGLARHLTGIPSLRLVVLNACRTARAAHAGPFASVGTALLQAEIPAVVAMQFPLSDPAALAFSRELYGRLVAGDPLEAAVTEGRIAIQREAGAGEWITPVVFLRAADGQIFEPLPVKPPPPDSGWLLWALAGLVLLVALAWSASRWVSHQLSQVAAAPPVEAGSRLLPGMAKEKAPVPVSSSPPPAPAPHQAAPPEPRRSDAILEVAPREVTLAQGSSLAIEAWQGVLTVGFLDDEDLQEMLGSERLVTVILYPRRGEEQRQALAAPGTLEFQIGVKRAQLSVTGIDWQAKTVRLLLPEAL